MTRMIPRAGAEAAVRSALRRNPLVALIGPRQCGKTTLARRVARGVPSEYFDLEDPLDQARLSNPRLVLGEAKGLVVLDEIQRSPNLFEVLRVLADRPRQRARFLILGSASPELVRGMSETLAGRVGQVELAGFSLEEVGKHRLDRLWLRGGFPRSYLPRSESDSFTWRMEFIQTFLERDVPQLGINIPAPALRRFWTMVAHYHGQVWNAAEFARSLGTSEAAARRYLDILTGAYVVRQLQPWFANVKKRQVKAPKIYVRDSGILNALLGLKSRNDVLGHPKSGASWEGFAIEQIIDRLGSENAYFWATHAGAELDLLILRGNQRLGLEVKRSEAPTLTRSMTIAIQDLALSRLIVLYPGDRTYKLAQKVQAVPLQELSSAVPKLS